eukprot:1410509-Heterocapsa_arctica.AAC.1
MVLNEVHDRRRGEIASALVRLHSNSQSVAVIQGLLAGHVGNTVQVDVQEDPVPHVRDVIPIANLSV